MMAETSAPVSSLNSTSTLFSVTVAVHVVARVSSMASKKAESRLRPCVVEIVSVFLPPQAQQ